MQTSQSHNPKLNIAELPQYHTMWRERIKTEVGASNVCFIQNRKGHYLRVIRKGLEERFKLVGTPTDISPDKYQELFDSLKDYYND